VTGTGQDEPAKWSCSDDFGKFLGIFALRREVREDRMDDVDGLT
jgi:hypothetical protein